MKICILGVISGTPWRTELESIIAKAYQLRKLILYSMLEIHTDDIFLYFTFSPTSVVKHQCWARHSGISRNRGHYTITSLRSDEPAVRLLDKDMIISKLLF